MEDIKPLTDITHSASYYFGRLNLLAQYTLDSPTLDKRELLLAIFQAANRETIRTSVWGFFDIAEVKTDEASFIVGWLVKYRPESGLPIANNDTQSVVRQEIGNVVVGRSRFVLHISSGVIAYRRISTQIEPKTFRERFTHLLETTANTFQLQAEILSIEDRSRLLDVISDYDRITSLRVYLHPSNPRNNDLWRDVDTRLKQLEVSSYHESYESSRKHPSDRSRTMTGKGLASDADITAKVHMAEDGYGIVNVDGERNGEKVRTSTQDRPVTHVIRDGNIPPNEIVEQLKSAFNDIFRRFI